MSEGRRTAVQHNAPSRALQRKVKLANPVCAVLAQREVYQVFYVLMQNGGHQKVKGFTGVIFFHRIIEVDFFTKCLQNVVDPQMQARGTI